MSEMKPKLPSEMNDLLDTFYSGQQPAPLFREGLEGQLRKQHATLLAHQASPPTLPRNRRSLMQSLRSRPILAVIVAILGLLLLTGVAYAVGRLFGFIPGFGFVEDVQSVLESPIAVNRPLEGSAAPPAVSEGSPASSQEREGITLTVEQVISEAERLVVVYQITGLPADIFALERAETLAAEQNEEDPYMARIRLADGTVLKLTAGGHCGGGSDGATSSLSCHLVRSPLPEDVNQFTLEIQRLPNALPGELPEDWVIPIQLTPVTSANSVSSIQEPNLHSQQVNGITMRLDKAVQTPSETAFQLALVWEGSNRFIHHTAPFTLQDAEGRYYILTGTGGSDGGPISPGNSNASILSSLVTSPVDGSSPLTFRLEWVVLSISGASADASGAPILRVDAGQTARLGQEWRIDQTIQAGGFDLHFTQARLKPGQDGTVVLEIDAQPQPGITSLNLFPAEGSSSYEAGYDKTRNVLVSRITLPDLPTKPMDLYISEILYKVDGPWEITWQPQPMSTTKPTPAPTRMPPPAATLVPGQPLLEEIQALGNKVQRPVGPGWVHQVIQVERAEQVAMLDAGDLPEQALRFLTDAWFLLDEDGYVRTTIYLRKTLDGRLLDANIDSGVYHFSLPEGRGGIGQDVYVAKPSYGLDQLSSFNNVVAEGGMIRRENGEVDGKSCLLYVATLPYETPRFFLNEPLPVQTMTYSACFDPETGTVLQTQGQMTYTDGSTRINSTTRFISIEKVEGLPDDVRQLLDQVMMP